MISLDLTTIIIIAIAGLVVLYFAWPAFRQMVQTGVIKTGDCGAHTSDKLRRKKEDEDHSDPNILFPSNFKGNELIGRRQPVDLKGRYEASWSVYLRCPRRELAEGSETDRELADIAKKAKADEVRARLNAKLGIGTPAGGSTDQK